MKRLFYILLIIFCLIIPTSLWAVTYHIKQTATGTETGASEANADSIAEFNADNINDGAVGIAPGDTINFHGTITSEIAPPVSGSAGGGYITLDGDDSGDYDALGEGSDGQAVIDRTAGAGVYGFALWDSGYGLGNGKDYLIIQDFEITDIHIGIYGAEGCDHIIIRRNFIHTSNNNGIWLGTDSGSTTGCSYVTIGGALGDGNSIKNIGTGTAAGDIVFSHGNDFIVSYNHLYADNVSYGIDGIDPMNDSYNILIEYNSIHDHNHDANGEDGIDLKTDYPSANGVHDVIIRYNHIYDHQYQSSIHPQTQTHHLYIYCNNLSDSNWGGVYAKEGVCATGCTATVHDIYIFSNLIWEERDAGIRVHATAGGTATDPYNFWVFNNTIAECALDDHSSIFTNIMFQDSDPDTLWIKNNILYKSRTGYAADQERQVYIADDLNDKSDIDYDQYYWPAKTSKIYLNGSWANAIGGHAGAETHGAEGDPGLVNMDANNYKIAAVGSAVVDAGVDMGTGAIATVTIQGAAYPVYWDVALGTNTVWGSGSTLPVMDLVYRDALGWDIGAYAWPEVTHQVIIITELELER